MQDGQTPRFIILEGVDGTGKTALFKALAAYYRYIFSNQPLYADQFPGTRAGTLGEWVYRFHRNRVTRAPSANRIAPPALQLLHVAAHVDAIVNQIAPTLLANGNIILDRYWWSTYAYSRGQLTPDQANALVAAERKFWEPLPRPVVIYVSRSHSLKDYQLAPKRHKELDAYYREIIAQEQTQGVVVHEMRNDSTLHETWRSLLETLDLPFIDIDSLRL